MSKSLRIASVIEKNKLSSDQPWLVALEIDVRNPVTGAIDDTIRIVRNDESVQIDGQTFQPMPFDITMEDNHEGLPSVSVVINDQTKIVQSYMQGYAGGVGFPVTFYVVTGGDINTLSSEAELTEYFEVVSGNSDSGTYTIAWELGVENPLSIKFPRRTMYTDQCSFRYKSGECGYDGTLPTCDRTLSGVNGCKVHANEENFGGFPGLIARG